MLSIKCEVLHGDSVTLIFFEIRYVVTSESTMSDPVMKWSG